MKKQISNKLGPLVLFFLLIWAGCAKEASNADTGTGGSMARFTVAGNYLYTVDFTTLRVYSLSNPAQPNLVREVTIGPGMETIFPYENYLLLGARDGMHIYNQEGTGAAQAVAEIANVPHFYSCDPVVAQNDYAYVTLRMSGPCGWLDSRLQVYDISNIAQPQLVFETVLTEPYGLGVDGSLLFVCSGSAGLDLFDISNPASPQFVRNLPGFNAYDVIPLDGLLLVVGPENVYQFDYTDTSNIALVSTIPYGL